MLRFPSGWNGVNERKDMKGKYLLVFVSLCCLASAAVGICMNTAGLFYKPIAEDLGVGIGSVSLTMTILTIASSFTALLAPKILKEKVVKIAILVATILMGGGTFLMSVSSSTLGLYAGSVMRGLGSGMTGFVLVTSIINRWYYKSHGVITSIAVAFSGIPGVILSPILTSIINNSGWRSAMMVSAVLIVLLCLPSLFVLTVSPQTQGLDPYGYEDFLKEKEKGNIRTISAEGEFFSYKDKEFILAVLFVICVCLVASLPNYLPAYAESLGLTSISGIILSVALAGNICSKVFFGIISDKLSAKIAIITYACICIVALIPLILHGNPLFILIAAFSYNFTASNSSVGISIITSDLFGESNYSKVYPMLSFIGSYALAFASAMIGFMYDLFGSYSPVLIAIMVLQICIVFITFNAYRLKKA